MRAKRGAIEIQFNWLFVLIIGAVILTLFVGIVLRQKDVSETSRNVLILNNLDAILAGSESTDGTVNVITMPETNIEFSCDRYTIGRLSKEIDVLSVFTPTRIKGKQIISLTQDFSMPYRVTNLLYLTTPSYRYVFVGATPQVKELHNSMPNESFRDIYSSFDEVEYRGEEQIRFIFFDDLLSTNQPVLLDNLVGFAKLPDRSVSALNIKQDRVEFLRKRGEEFLADPTLSPYPNDEALLGAVFTDDSELYSCVMETVFEKMNIVTQIYLDRTQEILTRYNTQDHRCRLQGVLYDTTALDTLKAASQSFTAANANTMKAATQTLAQQNRQAQLQSCATLY